MDKYTVLLICLLFCWKETISTPIGYQQVRITPIQVYDPDGMPRLNVVTGLLGLTGIFPIEVNVPLSEWYNGATSFVSGVQTNVGNFVQQIPFINRFITQNNPRPFRYVILLPIQTQNTPEQQRFQLPIGHFYNHENIPNLQYDQNGKITHLF